MSETEPKQLLMRIVMKIVEKQLATQGLRTFGAVLLDSREIKVLVPDAIKKSPTVDEVDDYWITQLRSTIADGHCKAACYCTDTRVSSDDGKPITSGVALFVEQSGGSAEYWFYPYEKREDSTIFFREPSIEEAPIRLFTASL
jgi:hypothetical protein